MINVSMQELSWGITFFVTIIILAVVTYKNSRWSILKEINIKSYLVEFFIAILCGVLSFVVMYINYIYCDNIYIKSFLLVLQNLWDILFETIAISMWFQRFNVFAPKFISVFIIVFWCFVEVTQFISSTIIFLVISFIGAIGPCCMRTINRK